MSSFETELNALLSASTCVDVEKVIRSLGSRIEWVPLGGNPGNYGIIRMGAEPHDGITERITNAMDAMIELEVELRPELKDATNPRMAVERAFGFKDGNLRWLDHKRIGELASNIKVTFLDSDDTKKPTIEIWDRGIGQHPVDFPVTLLGLNEDYKVSKLYLMGAFGQGGQTSFGHCEYGVLISRKNPRLLKLGQDDLIGWSIVRYRDPTTPQVIFKRGYWEYCVESGSKQILADRPAGLRKAFDHGTLIRLVSYGLPKGTSDVLQPASTAWSFLSQSLFDPALPMRLYEGRTNYLNRNRPLTGLAPRLWGGGRGEKAEVSKSDSYPLDLGTRGSVKVNYWAISPTNELESWRDIKKGFVSGNRAVFVTLYGQTHGVETSAFLRDQIGLTYAYDFVIIQIDCDGLTNQSKKELLSTTRDRLVEGEFKDALMSEVAQVLSNDRNLLAFERDRKARILSARSERDTSRIRSIVGRYIARNPDLAALIQSKGREQFESERQPKEPRDEDKDEVREEELDTPELRATPTFLRIANAKDPIPIEKGGNALVRLETDAVDSYYERDWDIRFRAIHGKGLTVRRACSTLRNGKISYHVHCPQHVRVGSTDEIRFELDLPDGPVLTTSRALECVPPYDRKREPGKQKLPEPRIYTVTRDQEPQLWAEFGWDEKSVGRVYIKPGEDSGIYVSLDNEHITKALGKKTLDQDVARAVQDRYVAGVAYYVLLKEVQARTGKVARNAETDDDRVDSSFELQRLAETIAALSLPIEAL